MGALLDLALQGMPSDADAHAGDEAANDRLAPAAEARRRRLLDMLAARPGIRYAFVTDDDAHPEAVVLALAIRGAMADGSTVTCELRVPRHKYDPFLLLDLVERHGSSVH